MPDTGERNRNDGVKLGPKVNGRRVGTSGVAERLEVERQLLHALSGLLIMLRVLRTGNQGDGLGLGDLQRNTERGLFNGVRSERGGKDDAITPPGVHRGHGSARCRVINAAFSPFSSSPFI